MGFVSREAWGRWEEWMSSDFPEQLDSQMQGDVVYLQKKLMLRWYYMVP